MKKSTAFKKLCKKFGVDPENIPEITSFEAACKITGDDPKKLPSTIHLPVARRKPVVALYKLEIITQALNENKRPDYTNSDEYKYWPYFIVEANKKNPSGSGLRYLDYGYWRSTTNVGVRLCFKSWEVARYAGQQFISLYEDAYLFR